jgi:hypothetical protein
MAHKSIEDNNLKCLTYDTFKSLSKLNLCTYNVEFLFIRSNMQLGNNNLTWWIYNYHKVLMVGKLNCFNICEFETTQNPTKY